MTTAPSSAQPVTAEEFFLLPEPAHGGKMELLGGKVVEHMPVGGKHGKLARLLSSALGAYTDATASAETLVESGYRLRRDPDTVLAPDVSVVDARALPGGRVPDTYIEGLPLLAIEIVSPNDSRKAVLAKVGEYLDCGVGRVWVVREKDQTVIVYGQDDRVKVVPRDGVLTSEDAGFEAPGFNLPVAEIFR